MFADIRKKSSSILVSLMFVAIIVTFVISFGPGDDAGCAEKKNYAANVNGDIITASDFRFSYSNIFDFYQRRYGDAFNNETAKQMKIAQNTLDGLIGETLMAQKAEDLGFYVSDEEIRKEILDTPYFQNGGKFDRDSYNKMVQFTLNTTVSAYENKVKLQLLSKKLRSFLFESIDISETELKDDFILKNEKIDVFVVSFAEQFLKNETKETLAASIKDEEVKKLIETDTTKLKLHFEDNVSKYSKKDDEGKTTFENSKEAVAKDILLISKIEEKISTDSKKFFEEIKKDLNMTPEAMTKNYPDWNISKKEALSIGKTATYIQGVGFSPKFVKKIYEKKEGLLEEIFVTEDKNHVIAWVKEYKPADMTKYDEQKEGLKNTLRSEKISGILQNYIDDLRKSANISINQDFLKLYEGPENGGGE